MSRSTSQSSTFGQPATFGGADKLSRLAWGTLLVLCGALFLDALDVSMMGVALPSIRTSLHMSTSSLQWVVSAYVLGYGGFLLLGGRAGSSGRRRVFLIALAVFIVASVWAASQTTALLIATRFIKGEAFTAPAHRRSSPRLRRGRRAIRPLRFSPRRVRPASHSGSSSAAC